MIYEALYIKVLKYLAGFWLSFIPVWPKLHTSILKVERLEVAPGGSIVAAVCAPVHRQRADEDGVTPAQSQTVLCCISVQKMLFIFSTFVLIEWFQRFEWYCTE